MFLSLQKTLKITALALVFCLLSENFSLAAQELRPALFSAPKPVLNFPKTVAQAGESCILSKEAPLVYLMQDAHTNYSGQRNLAKALDLILSSSRTQGSGKFQVFVEAGFGDSSLNKLRDEKEPLALKHFSESMLRQGLLHGEEYLQLTRDVDFTIWGVEDAALYGQALETYRHSAKNRENFRAYLQKALVAVRFLENRLYSPALLELSKQRERFLNHDIPFTSYLEALERCAADKGLRVSFFPALKDLKKLSSEDPKRLARKLRRLQTRSILEEQEKLEAEVFEGLTQNADQQALWETAKNLRLLEKLFSLNLEPTEFERFQQEPRSFEIERLTGFINQKLMELDGAEHAVLLEVGYDEAVQNAASFYRLALARDQKFVENMSAKLLPGQQAVLIAGGFHTPHLKTLLREKGISYQVLTPQVKQETNFKRYESVLLGQSFQWPSSTKDQLRTVSAARLPAFQIAANQLPRRFNSRKNLSEESDSDGARMALNGADVGVIFVVAALMGSAIHRAFRSVWPSQKELRAREVLRAHELAAVSKAFTLAIGKHELGVVKDKRRVEWQEEAKAMFETLRAELAAYWSRLEEVSAIEGPALASRVRRLMFQVEIWFEQIGKTKTRHSKPYFENPSAVLKAQNEIARLWEFGYREPNVYAPVLERLLNHTYLVGRDGTVYRFEVIALPPNTNGQVRAAIKMDQVIAGEVFVKINADRRLEFSVDFKTQDDHLDNYLLRRFYQLLAAALPARVPVYFFAAVDKDPRSMAVIYRVIPAELRVGIQDILDRYVDGSDSGEKIFGGDNQEDAKRLHEHLTRLLHEKSRWMHEIKSEILQQTPAGRRLGNYSNRLSFQISDGRARIVSEKAGARLVSSPSLLEQHFVSTADLFERSPEAKLAPRESERRNLILMAKAEVSRGDLKEARKKVREALKDFESETVLTAQQTLIVERLKLLEAVLEWRSKGSSLLGFPEADPRIKNKSLVRLSVETYAHLLLAGYPDHDPRLKFIAKWFGDLGDFPLAMEAYEGSPEKYFEENIWEPYQHSVRPALSEMAEETKGEGQRKVTRQIRRDARRVHLYLKQIRQASKDKKFRQLFYLLKIALHLEALLPYLQNTEVRPSFGMWIASAYASLSRAVIKGEEASNAAAHLWDEINAFVAEFRMHEIEGQDADDLLSATGHLSQVEIYAQQMAQRSSGQEGARLSDDSRLAQNLARQAVVELARARLRKERQDQTDDFTRSFLADEFLPQFPAHLVEYARNTLRLNEKAEKTKEWKRLSGERKRVVEEKREAEERAKTDKAEKQARDKAEKEAQAQARAKAKAEKVQKKKKELSSKQVKARLLALSMELEHMDTMIAGIREEFHPDLAQRHLEPLSGSLANLQLRLEALNPEIVKYGFESAVQNIQAQIIAVRSKLNSKPRRPTLTLVQPAVDSFEKSEFEEEGERKVRLTKRDQRKMFGPAKAETRRHGRRSPEELTRALQNANLFERYRLEFGVKRLFLDHLIPKLTAFYADGYYSLETHLGFADWLLRMSLRQPDGSSWFDKRLKNLSDEMLRFRQGARLAKKEPETELIEVAGTWKEMPPTERYEVIEMVLQGLPTESLRALIRWIQTDGVLTWAGPQIKKEMARTIQDVMDGNKPAALEELRFDADGNALLTHESNGEETAGIRQNGFFKGKKAAVLGDASLYAGHLLNAIAAAGNTLISVHDLKPDTVRLQLSRQRPDVIVAPEADQAVLAEIQTYARLIRHDVDVFFYETGHENSVPVSQRPNLSVISESFKPAREAIAAHVSQLPRKEFKLRTAYDKAKHFLSQAAGLIAKLRGFGTGKGDYADNFVVGGIDANGVLEPRLDGKFKIGNRVPEGFIPIRLKQGMPVLVSSPHPDDLEIAAPFLTALLLDKCVNVYNVIHSTGKNSVMDDDPAFKRFMKTFEGDVTPTLAKTLIRTGEAKKAAETLRAGRAGQLHVQNLMIDLQPERPLQEALARSAIREIFERHIKVAPGEPFIAVLAHPEDHHPTHRLTTEIDLKILRELAQEYKTPVRLLYYIAPWAGKSNTYYQHSRGGEANPAWPEEKKAAWFFSKGLAFLTAELTAQAGLSGPLGKRIPSPEQMGGGFVERVRRAKVSAGARLIEVEENSTFFLDDTEASRFIQSFSGLRATMTAPRGFNENYLASFGLYGFLYATQQIRKHKDRKLFTFVLARDPRPSGEAISEMLAKGFNAAARQTGVKVEIINLGIVTTPMAQSAVRQFKAEGGAIVTASHNPTEQNGVKFLNSYELPYGSAGGGSVLNVSGMENVVREFSQLRRRPLRRGYLSALITNEQGLPVKIERDRKKMLHAARRGYLSFLKSLFREEKAGMASIKNFPVVVDPNGGAGTGRYNHKDGGHIAWALEHFGMKVAEINRVTGKPMHEIEPSAGSEGVVGMQQYLKIHKKPYGVVFDYDADRGTTCPEMDPQTTAAFNVAMALAWMDAYNLSGKKEVVIVANDASSVRIEAIARLFSRPDRPVSVRRVETGEINVVTAMQEERRKGKFVPIGIEGSNGGTVFMESTCRDGVVTALLTALALSDAKLYETWSQVLAKNKLSVKDQSLESLVASLPGAQRKTILSKTPALQVSVSDLKSNLESLFVDEWNAGRFKDRYSRYRVVHYEETKAKTTPEKSAMGGWVLELYRPNGAMDFIWIRPSRTESAVRYCIDAREEQSFQELEKLFQSLFAEANNRKPVFSESLEFSVSRHAYDVEARQYDRKKFLERFAVSWTRPGVLKPQSRVLMQELVVKRVEAIRRAGIRKHGTTVPDSSSAVLNQEPEFMFEELIKNAFDSYCKRDLSGSIDFRVYRCIDSDEIVVEIRDRGIGIREVVNTPEAFRVQSNSYATSDIPIELEGGHGIGLLWTKILTESHGGDFEIISNGTTTIRMSFPADAIEFVFPQDGARLAEEPMGYTRAKIEKFLAECRRFNIHFDKVRENLNKGMLISDDTLRDGIQGLPEPLISPKDKQQLVETILKIAGISEIEIGSFVRGKMYQQMANTGEVLREVLKKIGDKPEAAKIRTLLFNEESWTNLLAAMHDQEFFGSISVTASADPEYAVSNLGWKDITEGPKFEMSKQILAGDVLLAYREKTAKVLTAVENWEFQKQRRVVKHGYISGVPSYNGHSVLEGGENQKAFDDLLIEYANRGISVIWLSDTQGEATPDQVRAITQKVLTLKETDPRFKNVEFGWHFHDSGLGQVNLLAAAEAGITRFDLSMAGTGGSKGADVKQRNASLEDFAFVLEALGITTGPSSEALVGLIASEDQSAVTLEKLIGRLGIGSNALQLQRLSVDQRREMAGELRHALAAARLATPSPDTQRRRKELVHASEVNHIMASIQVYKKFMDKFKYLKNLVVSGKINEFTDKHLEYLTEIRRKLLNRNPLAALHAKAQPGKRILMFNQKDLKTPNTVVGPLQNDRLIEHRQRRLTAMLIEAGIIRSEEDVINHAAKQDEFVISYDKPDLLQKLHGIATALSAEMASREDTRALALKGYRFEFFAGVSLPIQAERTPQSDRARIAAEVQALQAAKMPRLLGADIVTIQAYEYNEDIFDTLMQQSLKLRRDHGLRTRPEDLHIPQFPSDEEIMRLRGISMSELSRKIAAMDVQPVERARLMRDKDLKQLMEISDLFDYPKAWASFDQKLYANRDETIALANYLQEVIALRAPPADLAHFTKNLDKAVSLLHRSFKDSDITSPEAFHGNASDMRGTMFSMDAIGFYAYAMNRAAEACLMYASQLEDGRVEAEEKSLLVGDLTVDADDQVKKMLKDKKAAVRGFFIESGAEIPTVSLPDGTTVELGQGEGGDEYQLYLKGHMDNHNLRDEIVGRLTRWSTEFAIRASFARSESAKKFADIVADESHGATISAVNRGDNELKIFKKDVGINNGLIFSTKNADGTWTSKIFYVDHRGEVDNIPLEAVSLDDKKRARSRAFLGSSRERAFYKVCLHYLTQAKGEERVYLAKADMDYLSLLNKVYGKSLMTAVLAKISEKLREDLREIAQANGFKDDIHFIFSGDNISIVFPPCQLGQQKIDEILNDIRERVKGVAYTQVPGQAPVYRYGVASVPGLAEVLRYLKEDEPTFAAFQKSMAAYEMDITETIRSGGNLVLFKRLEQDPAASLQRFEEDLNHALKAGRVRYYKRLRARENWLKNDHRFMDGALWIPGISVGDVSLQDVFEERTRGRVAITALTEDEKEDLLANAFYRAEDALRVAKKVRDSVVSGTDNPKHVHEQHVHVDNYSRFDFTQVEPFSWSDEAERDNMDPRLLREEAFRRRVTENLKQGKRGQLVYFEPRYRFTGPVNGDTTAVDLRAASRANAKGLSLLSINNKLGHAGGDVVIKTLSQAFLSTLTGNLAVAAREGKIFSMRFVDKIWIYVPEEYLVEWNAISERFADTCAFGFSAMVDGIQVSHLGAVTVNAGNERVSGRLFEQLEKAAIFDKWHTDRKTAQGHLLRVYEKNMDEEAQRFEEEQAAEAAALLTRSSNDVERLKGHLHALAESRANRLGTYSNTRALAAARTMPVGSSIVRFADLGAPFVSGKTMATVLDVGCGPAKIIETLSRILGRALYVGLDKEQRVLDDNAKAWKNIYPLIAKKFVKGSAANLDAALGKAFRADLIVLRYMINLLDLESILAQASTILVPGGGIAFNLFSGFVLGDTEKFREGNPFEVHRISTSRKLLEQEILPMLPDGDLLLLEKAGHILKAGSRWRVLAPAIEPLPGFTPEEMKQQLIVHGFEPESIQMGLVEDLFPPESKNYASIEMGAFPFFAPVINVIRPYPDLMKRLFVRLWQLTPDSYKTGVHPFAEYFVAAQKRDSSMSGKIDAARLAGVDEEKFIRLVDLSGGWVSTQSLAAEMRESEREIRLWLESEAYTKLKQRLRESREHFVPIVADVLLMRAMKRIVAQGEVSEDGFVTLAEIPKQTGSLIKGQLEGDINHNQVLRHRPMIEIVHETELKNRREMLVKLEARDGLATAEQLAADLGLGATGAFRRFMQLRRHKGWEILKYNRALANRIPIYEKLENLRSITIWNSICQVLDAREGRLSMDELYAAFPKLHHTLLHHLKRMPWKHLNLARRAKGLEPYRIEGFEAASVIDATVPQPAVEMIDYYQVDSNGRIQDGERIYLHIALAGINVGIKDLVPGDPQKGLELFLLGEKIAEVYPFSKEETERIIWMEKGEKTVEKARAATRTAKKKQASEKLKLDRMERKTRIGSSMVIDGRRLTVISLLNGITLSPYQGNSFERYPNFEALLEAGAYLEKWQTPTQLSASALKAREILLQRWTNKIKPPAATGARLSGIYPSIPKLPIEYNVFPIRTKNGHFRIADSGLEPFAAFTDSISTQKIQPAVVQDKEGNWYLLAANARRDWILRNITNYSLAKAAGFNNLTEARFVDTLEGEGYCLLRIAQTYSKEELAKDSLDPVYLLYYMMYYGDFDHDSANKNWYVVEIDGKKRCLIFDFEYAESTRVKRDTTPELKPAQIEHLRAIIESLGLDRQALLEHEPQLNISAEDKRILKEQLRRVLGARLVADLENIQIETRLGKRKFNEDRAFASRIDTRFTKGDFFGVADGHGMTDPKKEKNRSETAAFVAEHSAQYFSEALEQTNGDIRKAIEMTFSRLEEETEEHWISGCTVSLVYVPDKMGVAYIGVLGDSPVLIAHPAGRLMHIGPMHHADNTDEQKLALKRGAIVKDGYIHLPGNIQEYTVTRSLGDADSGVLISKVPTIEMQPIFEGTIIGVVTDGVLETPLVPKKLKDRKALLEKNRKDWKKFPAYFMASQLRRGRTAAELVTDDCHDNNTVVVWRARGARLAYKFNPELRVKKLEAIKAAVASLKARGAKTDLPEVAEEMGMTKTALKRTIENYQIDFNKDAGITRRVRERRPTSFWKTYLTLGARRAKAAGLEATPQNVPEFISGVNTKMIYSVFFNHPLTYADVEMDMGKDISFNTTEWRLILSGASSVLRWQGKRPTAALASRLLGKRFPPLRINRILRKKISYEEVGLERQRGKVKLVLRGKEDTVKPGRAAYQVVAGLFQSAWMETKLKHRALEPQIYDEEFWKNLDSSLERLKEAVLEGSVTLNQALEFISSSMDYYKVIDSRGRRAFLESGIRARAHDLIHPPMSKEERDGYFDRHFRLPTGSKTSQQSRPKSVVREQKDRNSSKTKHETDRIASIRQAHARKESKSKGSSGNAGEDVSAARLAEPMDDETLKNLMRKNNKTKEQWEMILPQLNARLKPGQKNSTTHLANVFPGILKSSTIERAARDFGFGKELVTVRTQVSRDSKEQLIQKITGAVAALKDPAQAEAMPAFKDVAKKMGLTQPELDGKMQFQKLKREDFGMKARMKKRSREAWRALLPLAAQRVSNKGLKTDADNVAAELEIPAAVVSQAVRTHGFQHQQLKMERKNAEELTVSEWKLILTSAADVLIWKKTTPTVVEVATLLDFRRGRILHQLRTKLTYSSVKLVPHQRVYREAKAPAKEDGKPRAIAYQILRKMFESEIDIMKRKSKARNLKKLSPNFWRVAEEAVVVRLAQGIEEGVVKPVDALRLMDQIVKKQRSKDDMLGFPDASVRKSVRELVHPSMSDADSRKKFGSTFSLHLENQSKGPENLEVWADRRDSDQTVCFLEEVSRLRSSDIRKNGGARLALGAEPTIYTLSYENGGFIARAVGLPDQILTRKTNRPNTAPDAGQLHQMEDSVTAQTERLLENAGLLNLDGPVLLTVDLDVLDNDVFETNLDNLIFEMGRLARRKGMENLHFRFVGQNRRLVQAAWKRLDTFEKTYEESAEMLKTLRTRFSTKLPRSVKVVRLNQAGKAVKGRGLQLPWQTLRRGDVAALRATLLLAAATSQVDPFDIEDGFHAAYELLAGLHIGSSVLSDILMGRLDPIKAAEYALKALVQTTFENQMQYGKNRLRMLAQSA